MLLGPTENSWNVNLILETSQTMEDERRCEGEGSYGCRMKHVKTRKGLITYWGVSVWKGRIQDSNLDPSDYSAKLWPLSLIISFHKLEYWITSTMCQPLFFRLSFCPFLLFLHPPATTMASLAAFWGEYWPNGGKWGLYGQPRTSSIAFGRPEQVCRLLWPSKRSVMVCDVVCKPG